MVGAIYLDRGYDACMVFIKKRILNERLNIDKVAYKEVNFKSKLIEWCQKNKIMMRFEIVSQDKDKQGSPVFNFVVFLETVECCQGSGFSKKESQQEAAKLTFERLKREPQFIDEVFAAKTERTKMEEVPVEMIPDTGAEDDSPIVADEETVKTPIAENAIADTSPEVETDKVEINHTDEFDLSDIEVKTEEDMSRDEIVAAAEEAAFAG